MAQVRMGDAVAESLGIGALVDALARDVGKAEARDIVAALVDQPRHWPVTHAADPAPAELVARARAAGRKRRAGAPLAYAVGRAAFRHLTLAVDERVLIPRPETELLVDLVLGEKPGGTAIDVGTGSGAIALALAAEGRFERIVGTDISTGAVDVAAANGQAIGAAVEWRIGAFLTPVQDIRATAIVSNPPYISYEEARTLERSVRDWEPPVALLSGDGGMAAIRTIVRDAAILLEPGGLLALEVDARRASLAAETVLADGRYERIRVRLDLAGRERFVLARRTHTGSNHES